jgi:integrase
MGRRPAGSEPGADFECPRGVSLRDDFEHGDRRIQIAFSFRGVECRELLPRGPITKSAITYASGLRLEVLRRIKAGTFHYAEYFPDSPRARQFDAGGKRIMVRALLEAQLEVYRRQVANGTLKASTLEGYAKAINSERMAFWHDVALGEATPSKLRTWIGTMDVTAKRARNLLTPLRSVFEDAVNDELIDYNPFDRIALNKLLKQTTKASDYEVDPFTEAERDALLEAARADERPMLRFWFNTGLRPGELMALRWSRIDWIAHKARVDENLVSGAVVTPKTEAGIRDVELNDQAIAALQAQKPATFLAGQQVWLNPRTNTPWGTDAQIRKTLWEPLCKRAGVRYRNPYQVRHTYASALLTAGTNPWFVAQQLGHVDVQMVFKVYGKFIPQDYRRPKETSKPALRVVGEEP